VEMYNDKNLSGPPLPRS